MTAGPLTIGIVHPAPHRSRSGNRVTALRWAQILRGLGHRVFVERVWSGRPCDLLVGLHAAKTLDSLRAFRAAHPDAPLVVAGTGTDLYGLTGLTDLYGPDDPAVATGFALATRIVVLQPRAVAALPPGVRERARVLVQSVRLPPGLPTARSTDAFELAVVANLRAVKDPLLPARACALLPADSRLRVRHAGVALESELDRDARALATTEPRYEFLGELDHHAALALIASARALVIPSRNEGGANVLSEALALGLPVLSTRVPGTVGVLGDDHPGLFEVADAAALAALMLRAEREPEFLAELTRCSTELAPLVAPERERAGWRSLLAELLPA